MNININRTQDRLAVARGENPADIIIHNGKIVNVFTGGIEERSLAIFDGIIIGATWRKLELSSRGLSNGSGEDSSQKYDFRPDLLSRFEGAIINIPPLSDRIEDIIPHAKQICREINADILRAREKQMKDLSLRNTEFIENTKHYFIGGEGIGKGSLSFNDFSDSIQKYKWNRGNARELRIAIERYVTALGQKPMTDIIEELSINTRINVDKTLPK